MLYNFGYGHKNFYIYGDAFWNVRGFCSSDQQRSVRRWVNANNVSVRAFLETHSQEANILVVINSTLPGWGFDSNMCQFSGGGIVVV